MNRKTYNKLVRDRIPEIIEAEGRQYEITTMDETEYREALRTKLVEEAQEICDAETGELEKEIADLYEVIDSVIATYGLSPEAIHQLQEKRRTSRGGFEQRIKLVWAE